MLIRDDIKLAQVTDVKLAHVTDELAGGVVAESLHAK